MKRLLITILLACMAALPAAAGPIEDSIVKQLKAQGFTRITVGRTFLGRSRIVAQSPQLNREIIVNPATGEILRDYWAQRNGSGAPQIVDPNQPPAKENRQDDDDYDDDYDDDRDDNSGSGSGDDDGDHGNSGPGGGDDDGDDGDNDNSGHGGGGDDGDGDNSGPGGGGGNSGSGGGGDDGGGDD